MQSLIDAVGNKLVSNSIAKEAPNHHEFHLLADDRSLNAFAPPRWSQIEI
tara:strand:- start:2116 stop:2265 length:150 start_codon:yes stop_codon:yes gene_type:complete